MIKILKIMVILVLLLALGIGYCFLPTSPADELLNELKEKQASFKKSIKNKEYTILIDYEQPVFRKRLWLIENSTGKIVLNTFVSHAFNSGLIYAKEVSNQPGSEMSSCGCFVTNNSYHGQFGYSMQITGLEKGINHNVMRRAVVFHSCPVPIYSKGCFMTFPKINKQIIDLTKRGTFIFVNKDVS